jgi:hypothetical protein
VDCRAKTRPIWRLSRRVFSSKYSSISPAEMLILRVDSLPLWKIINEEDAVLIPKSRGRRELFQQLIAIGKFWGLGGVSRYAATLLIVALSSGYSDVTMFRPWSPTAAGNHLDNAENSKIFSADWHH